MSRLGKRVNLLRRVTPFTEKYIKDSGFTDFAKRVTTGFSRGHHQNAYPESAFIEAMWEEMINAPSEHLYDLDKCPGTQSYHSTDINPNVENFALRRFLRSNTPIVRNNSEAESRKAWKRFFSARGCANFAEFHALFPEISYTLNSLGFRTKIEFDDLEDNNFIPVFGCSHTLGVGLPEDWIWYNHLNETMPIFNCGVSSGGISEAYYFLTKLYKEKQFQKAYVVVPHLERFAVVSSEKYVESMTMRNQSGHGYLKEFADLSLSADTYLYHSNIQLEGLANFCVVNDIELRVFVTRTFEMFDWMVSEQLLFPPSAAPYKTVIGNCKTINDVLSLDKSKFPDYSARDFVHFGKLWHIKMANYLLTDNALDATL